VTPDDLREAYLATVLAISVEPGEMVPLEKALVVLPTPFHVLTACNPFSEQLAESKNLERMDDLDSALTELRAIVFPAEGRSPAGDWVEPSYAVLGLSREECLELGERFGQHAVFEVTDEEVIVLGCAGAWETRRSINRPPAVSVRDPGSESPAEVHLRADLLAVIQEELGIETTSTLIRAKYSGWEREGDMRAPCPECSSSLELFGCSTDRQGGEPVRLMAFICPTCRSILWPHEVSSEVRECAKVFRKLRAALDLDVATGFDDPYFVYVIELECEVDLRPVGTVPGLPWVYVGQSARDPETRFQQHLEGHKSSRWVRRYGSHLRPDLTAGMPELRTRVAALNCEAWLALSLRARGFPVKGGH